MLSGFADQSRSAMAAARGQILVWMFRSENISLHAGTSEPNTYGSLGKKSLGSKLYILHQVLKGSHQLFHPYLLPKPQSR